MDQEYIGAARKAHRPVINYKAVVFHSWGGSKLSNAETCCKPQMYEVCGENRRSPQQRRENEYQKNRSASSRASLG